MADEDDSVLTDMGVSWLRKKFLMACPSLKSPLIRPGIIKNSFKNVVISESIFLKRASGQIITTTSYDATVSAFLPNPSIFDSLEMYSDTFNGLKVKSEHLLSKLCGRSD